MLYLSGRNQILLLNGFQVDEPDSGSLVACIVSDAAAKWGYEQPEPKSHLSDPRLTRYYYRHDEGTKDSETTKEEIVFQGEADVSKKMLTNLISDETDPGLPVKEENPNYTKLCVHLNVIKSGKGYLLYVSVLCSFICLCFH